jgi:DNA mismatch repair protein MutL
VAVSEVARRRGTTVTVAALFHNAPARRKFLRGSRSEWRGVMDALTSVALVRRDVRLDVQHDGKPVVTLPRAESLRARLASLWGAAYASRFVDVDAVSGAIHVSGLAERPSDVGTAGRRIFLSVNGRAVRDAGVVRAAEAAYRTTIPAGVRPSLFLDLVVPADDLDVNVHPAKAEVRFRDRWPVERAVEHAVRRALGTLDSATPLGRSFWRPDSVERFLPPVPTAADVDLLRAAPSEPAGSLFAPTSAAPGMTAVAPAPAPASASAAAGDAGGDSVSAASREPVLQLRRTYLLVEHEEGVVLVDQHSAHERVLYERFMRALQEGRVASQRLLFPLTLHLGPAEGDAFEEHRDELARLGFEIEGFGGHTLLVSAVPDPHPRFDAERCLRETLAGLAGDREASVASRLERLASTVACKAAVKAGEYLAPPERHALLAALGATTLPAHDVHGRSTIVHLSWDELERRFGRR